MKFNIKRRKPKYEESVIKKGCKLNTICIGGFETRRRIFILEQVKGYKWEQLVVIRNDYPQDEIYHPHNLHFNHRQLNRIVLFELFGISE